MKIWGDFQHNVHTKFRENLSLGSKFISRHTLQNIAHALLHIKWDKKVDA
jgi:hypothetical protein